MTRGTAAEPDAGTVTAVTTRPAPDPAVAAVVSAAAAASVTDLLDGARYVMTAHRALTSPWLPAPTIAALAGIDQVAVRATVARNPATPGPVLADLARDPVPAVAKAVYANPNLPFAVADAHSPLLALAHADCPADDLADAFDRDELRGVVLPHPRLPRPLLARVLDRATVTTRTDLLAALTNPTVTHADAERVLTALDAAQDTRLDVRHRWARHPNADPAWLAAVARGHFDDPADESLRASLAAVAANPATPPGTLAAIAARHPSVWSTVATNPSAPAATLTRIMVRAHHDPADDPGVAADRVFAYGTRVACHPHAGPRALELCPVAILPADRLLDMVAVHATSGPHARAVLALAPTWTGNVADLLATAGHVLTPTG